jgi:hypothetical protein
METFTREKMVKAFKKWNALLLENPDDLQDIDATEECAEEQADTLIRFMNE